MVSWQYYQKVCCSCFILLLIVLLTTWWVMLISFNLILTFTGAKSSPSFNSQDLYMNHFKYLSPGQVKVNTETRHLERPTGLVWSWLKCNDGLFCGGTKTMTEKEWKPTGAVPIMTVLLLSGEGHFCYTIGPVVAIFDASVMWLSPGTSKINRKQC